MGNTWKRLTILLLCLLLVLPLVTVWAPTLAASGITLSSSVSYTFPTLMTFDISARSDVEIIDLRLHYVVDRQNYASVVSESWIDFNPATSVDTQWVWDMRKASLPPGSQVEYWWTAADAVGGRLDPVPQLAERRVVPGGQRAVRLEAGLEVAQQVPVHGDRFAPRRQQRRVVGPPGQPVA